MEGDLAAFAFGIGGFERRFGGDAAFDDAEFGVGYVVEALR